MLPSNQIIWRDNCAKLEIGAQVCNYNDHAGRRAWTIVASRWTKFQVEITIQHGRRTLDVTVPILHTGPCLADAGLRSLRAAPRQAVLPHVVAA